MKIIPEGTAKYRGAADKCEEKELLWTECNPHSLSTHAAEDREVERQRRSSDSKPGKRGDDGRGKVL